LLPKELCWWLWTIIAVLLFAGLAGYPADPAQLPKELAGVEWPPKG